jgi:microcystin-dependent protein
MAVETPPAFLQAGTYGAEQTRRSIYCLLARGASIGSVAGGLVGPTDCALSPPGSGMSVSVAPGEVIVPGSTSATQGGYYGRVSSSTSLSIAAADPTNPRIDTVIAQVQDAAYAGSTNSFQLAVVTGSPGSGATLSNLLGKGSVPASSVVLGYVLVPANATNVVSADIASVALPVTLGAVNSVQPGDLILSAGTSRAGCLLCDGSSYSATTYAALYGVIGYTFGGSGGSFNVPNYIGRTIVMPDPTGIHMPTLKPSLGGTGGEEEHTLTTPEMPSHQHAMAGSALEVYSGGSYNFPGSGTTAIASGSTENTGGGGSHNNVQPFGTANVFIKT